jgi:hypothetical protein
MSEWKRIRTKQNIIIPFHSKVHAKQIWVKKVGKKNFAKMLTREIFKRDSGQRRERKLYQLDSAEKVFDCDIKCTSPTFFH